VDRAAATRSPFAAFVDIFPGEHYRLLAALTAVLRPTRIVEIGTYTGASALAFLGESGPDAQVVTYDILAWADIPGTLLRSSDFEDGRLQQRLANLADEDNWESELDVFRDADLVFMDGPKDGVFEALMLKRLAALRDTANFVLVVDDIRFLEMLSAWADFPSPKLDATSFGHWSGTGMALVGAPLYDGWLPDSGC
jgi:predicted O-methyltransferase YrrM